MTYLEKHEVYVDQTTRDRAIICIKEQAHIYVNDGRKDISQLGRSIIQNVWSDIEAIWAAVITGPNWQALGEDLDLLAAVQSVWPTVADALYGHLIVEETPPAALESGTTTVPEEWLDEE